MRSIHRRTFLRGTGVALALPWLEAMTPRSTRGEATDPVRRMVCINTTLGIHAEDLFPEQPGRDYEVSPYLKAIAEHRDHFTVFSGVSHPEVDGGHSAEASFLTCAPHPGGSGFRNTISLDQFAAEHIGAETRFSSLQLATSGRGISVNRSGVEIPPEMRPSNVFRKLFVDGSADQRRQQTQRLKDGQSIMDTVLGQSHTLQDSVGRRDRETLDEYFNTVREVEQRLQQAEAWAHKPKPKVAMPIPVDIADQADILGRARLLYDLVHLAMQTDSTRLVTICLSPAGGVPVIEGVSMEHHNLSHHGMDPEKLEQLRVVEGEQMKMFGHLIDLLRGSKESGATLLDRTMVLYGSNLGNASSHDTHNLPIILAGGGFRHGQHLAFDRKDNEPLGGVFVAMLQRLGIDVDAFATVRGTIAGLEPIG